MAALKFGTHAQCPTTVLAGDWYEHTLLSSTHAQNSGTIVGTGSLCVHRFCPVWGSHCFVLAIKLMVFQNGIWQGEIQ